MALARNRRDRVRGPCWRNRERGQSIVELALVTPLLCIILFALIDFGVILTNQVTLDHAAADGARIAAQGDTPTLLARGQTQATSSTYQADVHNCSALDASSSPGYNHDIPDLVTITVSCTYQPITPLGALVGLIGGSLSTTPKLSATTIQRVQ